MRLTRMDGLERNGRIDTGSSAAGQESFAWKVRDSDGASGLLDKRLTEYIGDNPPWEVIQKKGFGYEFACTQEELLCLVNHRRACRTRLRHGDHITINGVHLLFSESQASG